MSIHWKKIFGSKKEFKLENPSNTGNINEVNQKLEITNSLIGAKKDGFKTLMDVESEWLNDRSYNVWELMNFQADYWVNLVQFTFKDNYLDNYMYNVIRYCWFYNKVGILFEGEHMIPIAEFRTEYDVSGKITYVEGFNAIEVFKNEIGILTPQNKLFNKYKITKDKIESKKYIRLINNSGVNNYYKWQKFANQQKDLMDRFLVLGVLFTKKIICKTGDPDSVSKELMHFLNSKSPFIYNLSGANFLKNTITSEGLDEVSPESFCLYYEKFLEYNYEMLGRRINSDEKGARNLTSEIETTQQNFYNLQNNWIINIKNFLEEFKKISGHSYEIINDLMLDPKEKNELTDQQKKEKSDETKRSMK